MHACAHTILIIYCLKRVRPGGKVCVKARKMEEQLTFGKMRSQSTFFAKISWGACPQTPLAKACSTCCVCFTHSCKRLQKSTPPPVIFCFHSQTKLKYSSFWCPWNIIPRWLGMGKSLHFLDTYTTYYLHNITTLLMHRVFHCMVSIYKLRLMITYVPVAACDCRLIAMATIRMNLHCLLHILLGFGTKLSSLKCLLITYHHTDHRHFLAVTFTVTSSFIGMHFHSKNHLVL